MASFADVIGSLDEQGRAPLYQQLQRALRDAITENRLAADEALPPERDLAEEFGVSRITVRKALDALVERGPADPPPGRRHLRAGAGREELLQAVVLHRGHDLARPPAGERLAQPLGRAR